MVRSNPWQTTLIALTAIQTSTRDEIKLIKDMRRRNPHTGLVVFCVNLRQREYTSSISGLYGVLHRTDVKPIKLPNLKKSLNLMNECIICDKKGQIDVIFVPTPCLSGEAEGRKFHQYTFIDEHSRFLY